MVEFKVGDKVKIVKEPTCYGGDGTYADRKLGDVTTINTVYGIGDNTIGIKCSRWIIDKDCLEHYREKINDWKDELRGTK